MTDSTLLTIWKRLWLDLQIDFWRALFQIRRMQYGDTNFGSDIRKREIEERQLRMRIIETSRAPYHAGVDWND